MSSRRSLFDVCQPLFTAMDMVGFQFGTRKRRPPERCSERRHLNIIKMLSAIPLVAYLLFKIITENAKPGELFSFIGIYSAFTYVFRVNESGMRELIVHLRSFRLNEKKELDRTMRNQLTFFKVIFVTGMTLAIFTPFMPFVKIAIDDPFEIFDPLAYIVVIPLTAFFTFFSLVLFLATAIALPLCFLACLVATYCTSSLDELVEEMKRTGSAARRARLSRELISHYRRLRHLAEVTDPLTTHFVFNLKLVNMIVLIRSLYSFPGMRSLTDIQLLFRSLLSIFLTVFNLLNLMVYLKVTSDANQMQAIISRAQIDLILMDDHFWPHDRDTTSHLFRSKVDFLIQLNEIMMDEEPFTSQGAPVDSAGVFTFVAEFIDLFYTLTARKSLRLIRR